ncbi:MAG: DUF58 domain-containing protein [Anaerolineales bacterium]
MANRRNAIYSLIILALMAALWTGDRFFFNLAYVFGLLLLGAFTWSWLAVNWVRIGRQTFAQRAQVGRYFDEQFTVYNTGIFPKLWLEVRDNSTLPGHQASHIVPITLPKRSYRWNVHTRCTQRGVFTLGPMTINSGDPFGLFQFPRHIPAISRIIVYPATVPVYEFASPVGRLEGGQALRRRTFEVTTNAAGIRDYAPGDSLNRIHWKTTARRGKLYVKEFELDPLSDVWIFVDFDRNTYVSAPGAGGSHQAGGTWQLPSNTEEYCVTCAASIGEYYIEKGRAVGMVAYTPDRQVLQPDRGERQLSNILEVLALAKSGTDKTLQYMLAIDADLIGRSNTLIVVSATLDTNWIGEIELLRRKGMHIITVIVDATSFGSQRGVFSALHAQVESVGVPVYPVKLYDNLTETLSLIPARQRSPQRG